jgi:hypothetical protein
MPRTHAPELVIAKAKAARKIVAAFGYSSNASLHSFKI